MKRSKRPNPPFDDWTKCGEMFNHLTQKWEPPRNEQTWVNSRYLVTLDSWDISALGASESDGTGWLLSIKRVEGGPVDDWRDKQRIKNELCDPECEAVELFPAESRLIDTADQAWMHVLPKGLGWPMGFHEGRLVAEGDHVHGRKGTQRPFEVKPKDLTSKEELLKRSAEYMEKNKGKW